MAPVLPPMCFDVAFEILPQRVHVNAGRLAGMDVVQSASL